MFRSLLDHLQDEYSVLAFGNYYTNKGSVALNSIFHYRARPYGLFLYGKILPLLVSLDMCDLCRNKTTTAEFCYLKTNRKTLHYDKKIDYRTIDFCEYNNFQKPKLYIPPKDGQIETERCSGSKKNPNGLSPRENYTDRATADLRRSDCQLLRIEGAT
jgi:hypothetical protein